jgi:ATP-binding protein involved in chromosome partitioning
VKDGEVNAIVELTTPACPVKDMLKEECTRKILEIPGVDKVSVSMTARTLGSRKEPSLEALAGVKNIVAVASGKGGVGKSTTSVNLAYGLAKQGSRVGLLDADIYGPSLVKMTGVGYPEKMEGQMIVPPEMGGVKIVSMPMFAKNEKAAILRGPMAAQVIKQFLTQIAWGELDYLIIDYPPGTGDIQLTISQIAPLTGAVIVTTPQEISLIDVKKAVEMFVTMKVPILGVIETMSYFVCDGCDKKHDIFRSGGGSHLTKEMGVPMLAQIPLEPQIALVSDQGKAAVDAAAATAGAQAYMSGVGKLASQISIINSKTQGALDHFSLTWN